jgi:hypothetical protein
LCWEFFSRTSLLHPLLATMRFASIGNTFSFHAPLVLWNSNLIKIHHLRLLMFKWHPPFWGKVFSRCWTYLHIISCIMPLFVTNVTSDGRWISRLERMRLLSLDSWTFIGLSPWWVASSWTRTCSLVLRFSLLASLGWLLVHCGCARL